MKYDAFKLAAAAVDRFGVVPALSAVTVQDGRFLASDCTVFVSTPAPGEPDGVRDTKGFALQDEPRFYEDCGQLTPVRGFKSDDDIQQRVELGDLPAMLRKVAHCAAKNDMRWYLNAVLFDMRGSCLELVATDGTRLAAFDTGIDTLATGDPIQLVVPVEAIKILLKCRGGSWTLRASHKLAEFREEETGVIVSTLLLDANYPDYGRVIPRPNEGAAIQLTGDTQEMRKTMAQFTRYGNTKGKPVAFLQTILAADCEGFAPLRASLPAKFTRYDSKPFAVDARYMSEAMKVVGNGTFTLEMGSPTEPARLTFSNEPHLVQVLMPMRIPLTWKV